MSLLGYTVAEASEETGGDYVTMDHTERHPVVTSAKTHQVQRPLG